MTQRSAVQIRPPTMNATAEMQWRSPELLVVIARGETAEALSNR
jgi:hypothetical protein